MPRLIAVMPWRTSACSLLLLATELTACSTLEPGRFESGLEVVVQRVLVAAPFDVAACLEANEGRVSYPRGLSPQFTTRSIDGPVVRVDQWFFIHRAGGWTTSFTLRPAAGGGTDVQVRMPTELTVARLYAKAANELVDLCARG